MEVAKKIHDKLERILKRLKDLRVIQSFKLEINFCQIEGNLKTNLIEIDSVLKKCLRKIITKPRQAEIRNIITELIRKKNLGNVSFESQNGSPTHTYDNFLEIKIEKPALFENNSVSQKDDAADLKLIYGNTNQEFESRKTLVYNKNLQRNIKFLCEMCGKTFCSTLRWKCHNQKHLIKSEFNCQECLRSIYSLKKCKVHYKIHETVLKKRKKYNHGFNNLSQCQFLKENSLTCVICKGSFCSKKILEHHMSEEHGKIIPEKNDLEIETPKTNKPFPESKFICKCGKVFRLRKTLKKHESVKHSEKNIKYICSECKKSFNEKGKLNRHMLSHKERQYQCPFCSQQFARSDALKRHSSLAHHPQKEFPCSFCQKKFRLKYNRDVHEENMHKNANNWIQCDQCGQKCRNIITFKSHFKTHLEKKVTCSICSKSFNRKVQYQNHIKKKHFGISLYQTLLDSVTDGEI